MTPGPLLTGAAVQVQQGQLPLVGSPAATTCKDGVSVVRSMRREGVVMLREGDQAVVGSDAPGCRGQAAKRA
jgi:hypothetical protein